VNFVTPNSAGFAEADGTLDSAVCPHKKKKARAARANQKQYRQVAAGMRLARQSGLSEVGWTDAARIASALARRGMAAGRRAGRIALRRKVPKLDLWPSMSKTKPYRSFENGRMVRLHGAPVKFR